MVVKMTTITTNTTANSLQDVQRMKSVTEKLRLEITTLRDALQVEKHAVRELKVQNDKNLRKHKFELQQREQHFKRQLSETHARANTSHKLVKNNGTNASSDSSSSSSFVSDFCENCRKLKQTSKDLEERLNNVLEADRIKASDLRTQHDNHLIELQRLQRSTRIETQRLLEELKTKDHLIDQLKRRQTFNKQHTPIRKQNFSEQLLLSRKTATKSTQTSELMRKLINSRADKLDNDTIDASIISTITQQVSTTTIPQTPSQQCNKNGIVADDKSKQLTMVIEQQSPLTNTILNNNCTKNVSTIDLEATNNSNNQIDGLMLLTQQCCHQTSSVITNEESIVGKTIEMPPALKERLIGHLIDDVVDTNLQQQIFSTNNQKQYLKEEKTTGHELQSQTNKHRKELYYRPLVDLEPVVEEDTDSAVSSAPSSLSPQPYHHHVPTSSNGIPTSPFHHMYDNNYHHSPNQTDHHIQSSPSLTSNTFDISFNKSNNFQHPPPTSLSPQPSDDSYCCTSTNTSPINYRHPTTTIPPSSQQQQQQQQTTSTDLWYRTHHSHPHGGGNVGHVTDSKCDDVELELLETTQCLEKGELQTELAIAKCQVRELERALLVTREVKLNNQNTNKSNDVIVHHNNALTERIRRLETREATLLRELQELREQNELQEFRILELEECHEKWSLRSQSSSELRDIESSRVTPIPSSHDMLEYKGDVVREHLLVMSRKTSDVEDKHCLQQVLTLLDNLESLSQEHSTCCLDEYSNNGVDYYSNTTKFIRNEENNNNYPKQIATVLPFIENNGENDDFTKHLIMKKKQLSNASSLQESGIFEGELTDTISVETQTENVTTISPMPSSNKTNLRLSELTAEIQKLNQIRASIEENGKKCTVGNTVLPINKELEYYKNRLEILENKINVYESSGDMQMKKLKERLNHEIVLTSQVNDLQQKVCKLEKLNRHLEEEKCEFEEAENDTRLQYQQLEMELKVTSEYLRDVEEARSASKRKAKEAKASATYWESMFARCEARNYELEEHETELQCRLNSLEQITPILILYNIWSMYTTNQHRVLPITYRKYTDKSTQKCFDLQNELNLLIIEKNDLIKVVKHLEDKLRISTRYSPPGGGGANSKRIQELIETNKELRKQIDLHKHREDAYIETLQQADNIWAEMETEYKKRIQVAEDNEIQLRTQVRQLEENDVKLRKNIGTSNERIIELEDAERRLEDRIKFNEKEQKYLLKENLHLKEELNNAKSEWRNMKDNLEGSLHIEMERLRKKIRALQEEIDVSAKVLEDTEDSHQKEITIIKMQLQKTNKELVHLDITNSELREEITQLETRISELQTGLLEQRINSDRTIKNLTSELAQRDKQCLFRKRSFNNATEHSTTLSLRDELQKSDSNIHTS